MSIEIIDSNSKKCVYKISYTSISHYEEIIDKFNKKYNNLFDFNNDFRLYENHIRFIIELIGKEINKNSELLKFQKFLMNFVDRNKTLIVIGN